METTRDATGALLIVRGYTGPSSLPPAADPYPGLVRELSPEQRAIAVGDLERAVERFIDGAAPNDGVDSQAARRLVALHAHRLALTAEGVPVLLVETPGYKEGDKGLGATPADQYGIAGWRGCGSLSELRALRWLESVWVPTPLVDAIPLLLGAENPEREMQRRRAAVEAEKKAAADASARAAAEERERQRKRREWESKNRVRIEAWAKLSPHQRALHTIAHRFPALGEALVALAELEDETLARRSAGDPPDSFQADRGWWEE